MLQHVGARLGHREFDVTNARVMNAQIVKGTLA
jgi:hypothetical protein